MTAPDPKASGGEVTAEDREPTMIPEADRKLAFLIVDAFAYAITQQLGGRPADRQSIQHAANALLPIIKGYRESLFASLAAKEAECATYKELALNADALRHAKEAENQSLRQRVEGLEASLGSLLKLCDRVSDIETPWERAVAKGRELLKQ